MADIFAMAFSASAKLQAASRKAQSLPGDAAEEAMPLDVSSCSVLAPSQVTPTRAKKKGPQSQTNNTPPTLAKKRKKMNPSKKLLLQPVPHKAGEDITCVFVKRDKTKVVWAVALWRQYTCKWQGYDFRASRWIVVSNYEQWLQMVVSKVTGGRRVRDVAKVFTDHFQGHFKAALSAARRQKGLADPANTDDEDKGNKSDDGECSKSSASQRPHSDKANVILEITIATFDISCLNTKRRTVLKLEPKTVKFISEWMLPLIVKASTGNLAPSQATAPMVEGKPASEGFQIAQCPTPNVRDKVVWAPMEHSWKLCVKAPKEKVKALLQETFEVDRKLDSTKYEEAKVRKYWRAIEVWNTVDGSNRHRIQVH